MDPNVANIGGLQSQGVKGEVVVLYFEPLTTQNLKSSGVPRCFKGKQHGKIDPILRIHDLRVPENSNNNEFFRFNFKLLYHLCHFVYATKGFIRVGTNRLSQPPTESARLHR